MCQQWRFQHSGSTRPSTTLYIVERELACFACLCYCCNLSGGVALNMWFTTNGMCVKNNPIHIRGANKQQKSDRGVEALPILTCERLNVMTSVRGEWSWHVNSIVACCHSAKLCAHAARDFRSQHYHPLHWLRLLTLALSIGHCQCSYIFVSCWLSACNLQVTWIKKYRSQQRLSRIHSLAVYSGSSIGVRAALCNEVFFQFN